MHSPLSSFLTRDICAALKVTSLAFFVPPDRAYTHTNNERDQFHLDAGSFTIFIHVYGLDLRFRNPIPIGCRFFSHSVDFLIEPGPARACVWVFICLYMHPLSVSACARIRVRSFVCVCVSYYRLTHAEAYVLVTNRTRPVCCNLRPIYHRRP